MESVRRATVSRSLRKKYSKGFLGRWAAGGLVRERKGEEQRGEEGREESLRGVREGVLWDLGRRLEGVGEVQRGMMERRLGREVERGRSVLYQSRGELEGNSGGEGGGKNGFKKGGEGGSFGAKGWQMEDEKQIESQLSPEQLQLFARENQDMLKRYEDTLDQVRYVTLPSPPPFSSMIVRISLSSSPPLQTPPPLNHSTSTNTIPPSTAQRSTPSSKSPSSKQPSSKTWTSNPRTSPNWSPTR